MTEGKTGARLRLVAGVMAFMFATLITRLWFLQVMAADELWSKAQSNFVRAIPIPAPRGRIVDRNEEVLVENRTSRMVKVKRSAVRNREQLLLDLSRVLNIPANELGKRLDDPDFGPFEWVPIAEDVAEEDLLYLAEHKRQFPGVDYGMVGVRDYPRGALAAHVLGYLGQLGPEELTDPRYSAVRPGQLVGRGGIEQQYEHELRGRDGHQFVEVDARGAVIERLTGKPPIAGNDIVLSIDRRIQRAAEQALLAGVEHAHGVYHEDSGTYLKAAAGAVVVMNPRNGEVLAMASYPTYDPRVFLKGLSLGEWRQLENPKRNFPLNNRAIQGQYPPGSTLKPFVAAASVKAKVAEVNGFYPCPPEFTVKGDTSKTVWRNWKDQDSGVISFGQALVESCDTVFYKFGLQFYRDRKVRGEALQQHLRRWGFGADTGVTLPGEQAGRVPDAAWKAIIHQKEPKLFPDPVWYPGDSINMSIGQGDLLATPMQVATAFSALGNGGTVWKPRLALRAQSPPPAGGAVSNVPPQATGKLPYSKKLLRSVVEALQGVVTNGTAAHPFLGFPLSSIPVAGKTGTSEVPNKQPHSWFGAMAPAGNPDYVVVAVIEEGGHGSEVAAPVVRRILEHIYDLEETPFLIAPASD
jgi:penicillin-binding protein 2